MGSYSRWFFYEDELVSWYGLGLVGGREKNWEYMLVIGFIFMENLINLFLLEVIFFLE